jgi:hypothetical protein
MYRGHRLSLRAEPYQRHREQSGKAQPDLTATTELPGQRWRRARRATPQAADPSGPGKHVAGRRSTRNAHRTTHPAAAVIPTPVLQPSRTISPRPPRTRRRRRVTRQRITTTPHPRRDAGPIECHTDRHCRTVSRHGDLGPSSPPEPYRATVAPGTPPVNGQPAEPFVTRSPATTLPRRPAPNRARSRRCTSSVGSGARRPVRGGRR